MKKVLIFNAFLLAIITILLTVVCLTIASHKATIDRIAPSTEELKLKAEKMGSLTLTEKEVVEICDQLNNELNHLNKLKWLFTFIIVLIIVITLAGLYKFNLRVIRFDGLSLLVVALLLCGIHWLVYEFSGGFYGGHNAAMDIRIGIFIGALMIQPILFYVAYRMNELELSLQLHKQKWVSYTAIAVTILSVVLALVIAIGALMTPDLSGNISMNERRLPAIICDNYLIV